MRGRFFLPLLNMNNQPKTSVNSLHSLTSTKVTKVTATATVIGNPDHKYNHKITFDYEYKPYRTLHNYMS